LHRLPQLAAEKPDKITDYSPDEVTCDLVTM
jgi:hypothetical protein